MRCQEGERVVSPILLVAGGIADVERVHRHEFKGGNTELAKVEDLFDDPKKLSGYIDSAEL